MPTQQVTRLELEGARGARRPWWSSLALTVLIRRAARITALKQMCVAPTRARKRLVVIHISDSKHPYHSSGCFSAWESTPPPAGKRSSSACKVAATAGREHGGCLGAVMVVVSVVLMVVFAPETLLRDREKVSREIIMELASERHGTVAGDPNGMVSQTVVGEVNTYDKIYSVTDFGFFAAAEERRFLEHRVKSGWDKIDSLHEAFAQSISQVLANSHSQVRGHGITARLAPTLCRHKVQLLTRAQSRRVRVRSCTNFCSSKPLTGMVKGWMTLTSHKRNELQSVPAASFHPSSYARKARAQCRKRCSRLPLKTQATTCSHIGGRRPQTPSCGR